MSVEVLHRAATAMRDRAEAATSGPWEMPDTIHGDPFIVQKGRGFLSGGLVGRASGEDYGRGNAQHIASWHPTVVLAVADWLDAQAALIQRDGDFFDLDDSTDAAALAVARAYLGESA